MYKAEYITVKSCRTKFFSLPGKRRAVGWFRWMSATLPAATADSKTTGRSYWSIESANSDQIERNCEGVCCSILLVVVYFKTLFVCRAMWKINRETVPFFKLTMKTLKIIESQKKTINCPIHTIILYYTIYCPIQHSRQTKIRSFFIFARVCALFLHLFVAN